MNEDRLSSMLKEFAEPIVATNIRVKPVRSRRALRLGVVGLGFATALMAGLVIAPRISDAATLHRIELAISNAKSMKVVSTGVGNRGKRHIYNTTWYQDGRWRSDIFPGLTLAKTFIVREGEQFIYTPAHGTLTEEPAGPWNGPMGKMSALDFAKNATDLGEVSQERTMTIEPHAPVDGRTAYQIVMKREGSDYRSEILVDKETDLPIRARTILGSNNDVPRADQVEEFQFNNPIPPEKFDPRTLGLPILNLTVMQDDLLRKWAKPVAFAKNCAIRDVWQNSAGEVFVAYTRSRARNDRVENLYNSLGTQYLKVEDIEPGQIRGDTGVREHFKFEGADFRIAVFAPLEKPESLPARVGIDDLGDQGVRRSVDSSNVAVQTGPPDAKLPSYATALVLRDYADQMAIHLASARAKWYHDHKDPAKELVWRRAAYERAEEWVPTFAEKDYKPAVDKLVHEMGLEKP